jgi:hypothetical protein
MREFAPKFATLALAGFLAMTSGCVLGDDSLDGRSSKVAEGAERFQFCSAIASRLRGVEVAVYAMRDDWTLVVAQHKGTVLCIDDPPALRQAGVIPIDMPSDPACSFCEGTPLPASVLFPDDEPPTTSKTASHR